MIQTPALVLSLVLATLYGAAFHLWRGRGIRDLISYWLAAGVGFACGQLVGQILDIVPWTIGEVHIVEATLMAALFLFLARWLRQENRLS
jgi:hypothetical protein